jgi:hypothetical protein
MTPAPFTTSKKVRKGDPRSDGDREMNYPIECSREVAVLSKRDRIGGNGPQYLRR